MYDRMSVEPLQMLKPKARDLIMQLLQHDQLHRPTAEVALDHEWFEQRDSDDSPPLTPLSPTKSGRTLLRKAKSSLTRACSFHKVERFQRAILRLVAHYLQEKELMLLKALFDTIDTDHKGSLSQAEIRSAVQKAEMNINEADLVQAFIALDADGTGKVHYTEWLAATIRKSALISEKVTREVFSFFDSDNSGKINRDELRQVLGEEFGDRLLQVGDVSGDEELDWEEFKDVVANIAEAH